MLSKWIFLHALKQTEAENRRGKAKKQKQSQGLQAGGQGPAGVGRAESEVGRPGSEAQSKQPPSRLQARAARAANTCSSGLRARSPSLEAAGGRGTRLLPPRPCSPAAAERRFPEPASCWGKEVRFGKLSRITYPVLASSRTPRARVLKFILCAQANTFTLEDLCKCVFARNSGHRVRARRRPRLFIINDAASPHHYDDNYYYCCDFGLPGESCRRRGGGSVGLPSRPVCLRWPLRPALCAGMGVEKVNLEAKGKLATSLCSAMPLSSREHSPSLATKNAFPERTLESTRHPAGSSRVLSHVGVSTARPSASPRP